MFIVEKKTPMKSAMNSQTIFENYDLDQQLKIIKVNSFINITMINLHQKWFRRSPLSQKRFWFKIKILSGQTIC